MTSPDLVYLVKQDSGLPDCAVAALAMLCGVTYGEALAAFPEPDRVMKTGAYFTTDLKSAAKKLGIKTRVRRRFDIYRDTGILYLAGKQDNHVAFLWVGRVLDGDGACWLFPHVYLKARGFKANALLSVQPS
jgi:hypothetical protein